MLRRFDLLAEHLLRVLISIRTDELNA